MAIDVCLTWSICDKTVAEMDQLQTLHCGLEKEFLAAQSTIAELTSDVELLRDESLQLRNKVVELIK